MHRRAAASAVLGFLQAAALVECASQVAEADRQMGVIASEHLFVRTPSPVQEADGFAPLASGDQERTQVIQTPGQGWPVGVPLFLFDGDGAKIRELDRLFARQIGFGESFAVTGQTYPRKQDSQILGLLAGVGESCHKLGTDVRLLQGMGEISEPFGSRQVGSSAMAYKRNPIRSERMCALSRRLITDSLNGPLTAATQWLERSLDDSANRRLVLPDSFLLADAILGLAAGIVHGLNVNEPRIRFHVDRELPFMATESLLMRATLTGGDRQHLHELIRQHSMTAHAAVSRGDENPLIELLQNDSDFPLDAEEIDAALDPHQFIGRSPQQVLDFLEEVVTPALIDMPITAVEEPRV